MQTHLPRFKKDNHHGGQSDRFDAVLQLACKSACIIYESV